MLSTLSRNTARLAVQHSRRHAITASIGAINEKHTVVLIRFDLVVAAAAFFAFPWVSVACSCIFKSTCYFLPMRVCVFVCVVTYTYIVPSAPLRAVCEITRPTCTASSRSHAVECLDAGERLASSGTTGNRPVSSVKFCSRLMEPNTLISRITRSTPAADPSARFPPYHRKPTTLRHPHS